MYLIIATQRRASLVAVSTFTALCYAERSIATACRVSVCLSLCKSVRDVDFSWSHRLEFFENNFTVS